MILRCHPAWRVTAPTFFAYFHMLTFVDGGSSLRLAYLEDDPFGSLSGVHSSPRFLRRFQLRAALCERTIGGYLPAFIDLWAL